MMFNSYPIVITTKSYQVRKHRKYRINKKWLKRFGTYNVETMPTDKVVMLDGKLYMSKSMYENLLLQTEDNNNG